MPHSFRARGSRVHQARLGPGRHELLSVESVWQELEARGATIATVPFSGRTGRSGRTDRIVLSRRDRDELVDVERWTGRDELCYALEAPIWDRFGSFAGQPADRRDRHLDNGGPSRRDRRGTR